jgi:threonine/homoserine/homoserine lactone efflux protein
LYVNIQSWENQKPAGSRVKRERGILDSIAGAFFTSFALGFTGAVVPGPLLAVVVSSAGRRGFWAGPVAVAGHGVLELVLGLALLTGFARLGAASRFLPAVSLLGAAALLGLGAILLKGLFWGKDDFVLQPGSNSGSFLAAMGATISNPYWSLWWLTVGLELILLARGLGAAGFASLYLGHLMSDLVWYSLVALGIVLGRQFLSTGQFRMLLGLCAVSMIGFAAYFAVVGVSLLR